MEYRYKVYCMIVCVCEHVYENQFNELYKTLFI